MESGTPSARDVAAKILGRSGLVTGSRNIKESVTTPSEDATPKTLIGGILNAASISKSGLVAPPTRKSKLTKSPTTGPPAKRKKAMRQSLGDNATPRTIIKNFLMEASPETPLEVPPKLPEKMFHDESSESDSSDQSLSDDIQAPASSPEPDSKDVSMNIPNPKEICDSEMDSLSNLEDSKSALAGGVKEGNNAFSREDSVNKDNEDKEVLSPAPVNAEVDITEISPEPGYESSTTTATTTTATDIQESQTTTTATDKRESQTTTATDEQESQTTTTATDKQESQMTTTATDKQESQATTTATDKQESQTTTTATDEHESHSDSIPDTDIIMPFIDTGTSEPPSEKRIWKELMTPHELPVKRRNVLSEKQMAQVEEEEENESERTSKAVKKPPPATKRTKTKSTPAGDTNLPSGLVKSIFQHFSKSRISRNTINSIEKGSSVFFKQISSDLMAYSKHAGRSTIETGDVELLMKRQGFVTDKQSLNSLIEKYLPLEYRQELIPVVQSGNKVVLKKSN